MPAALSPLQDLLARRTREGELYEKLPEGRVRCFACGHRCLIPPERDGICRVRFNEGGTLKVPFGYVGAVHVDPVEKKPFFHALPGARALSFGMLGCDYHCGYCQNWLTSQALRDPDDRTATVVSSPLLGVAPASRPGRALRAVTKLLLRWAPRLLVPNKVDPGWLSHDPEVGRAYVADPLVSRKVSAGWFRALQRAFAEAHAGAPRWASPLLVLASRGDRLVDPDAVARWVAAAPAALVSSVFWEDLYHELFNETTNADVFAAMDRWLEARLQSTDER